MRGGDGMNGTQEMEAMVEQMREIVMARGRTQALLEVSTLLRNGLLAGWTLREFGERFVTQMATPNLTRGLQELQELQVNG